MADFPVSLDDLAPASVERSHRFEVILTILLACTAIAGAYAAYRADLNRGDSLRQFQVANKTTSEGTDLLGQADAAQALDQQIFVQYAKAVTEDKAELAQSLGFELSPTLTEAIKAWEADTADESASPFVGDDPYYAQPLYADGEAKLAQSDKEFEKADDLRRDADRFTLITVFLASALFLFGIASVARNRIVRLGMSGVGGVIFGGATIALLAIAF